MICQCTPVRQVPGRQDPHKLGASIWQLTFETLCDATLHTEVLCLMEDVEWKYKSDNWDLSTLLARLRLTKRTYIVLPGRRMLKIWGFQLPGVPWR